MALTDKLSAIGVAIRAKTGKTDLITLDDMPAEIASIETGGGGGGGEVEPIVLTGDQSYSCAGALAGAYIDLYGDTITTKDISTAPRMFAGCTAKKIPFELNFYKSGNTSLSCMFSNSKIHECPEMNNVRVIAVDDMFSNSKYIRNLPENLGANWDWSYIQNYKYADMSNVFTGCYSLRSIPSTLLSNLWGIQTSTSYICYPEIVKNCYVLDELINLPVSATITSNSFSNSFSGAYRLKNFTFETNADGSSKTASWKSQTIDLTTSVGREGLGADSNITGYNSGITADKKVINDATYQALKNDPDWWTSSSAYCRYNHDSAIATINSLPDTSAYLATAGGTNTIKFKGADGSATDGGAINTLTEEEIAVAAAKGWTVTLS